MDLPFTSAEQLPEWLPDETVFSWASRYHALAGHRLASQTCQALFGDYRQGSQHDFPTRLGHLAELTGDLLGTQEEMACDRTLLRYYLVTRTPHEAAAAITSLVEQRVGVLKFRLGILTSRFRANHPLKACPICMEADRAAWGSSYWHLAHQYPGAWICRLHDTPLLISTIKTTGIHRFGWMLPSTAKLVDTVADASITSLRRFAELVAGWSSLAPGSLTAAGIAAACRLQLKQKYTPKAPASRAEAGALFADAIADLRHLPELRGLPATSPQAKGELDRWMFAPRGNTHPLRHLAIIYWLFSHWNEFTAAYDEACSLPQAVTLPPRRDAAPDLRRLELVRALSAGKSVTSSAKLIGVTVGTAIAWAAQHGFKIPRRPKFITDSLRMQITAELGRGDEKPAIAERHAVSVQAVTRILRSEVGLADQRHLAQFEQAKYAARLAWQAAFDAWPGATVTHLRAYAGGAYAWLRRHDAAWLDAHLPQRTLRPPAGRVDWDRRDVALAAEVRRVAAELAATSEGARLRAWQIYQALPELKAKQGALARLPLTAQALSEATRLAKKDRSQRLL